MSDLLTRLRVAGPALGRWVRTLPRPSAGWLAVRLLVAGLGTASLLVVVPSDLVGAGAVAFAAVVAAVAAAAPGTVAALAVQLLAVSCWLFSTWVLAEPVTAPRVIAVTVLLYLHHVVSAYAAVLPLEAAFSPGLLVRALSRTGMVLAVAVPLGVGGFLLTERLSVESSLAAPLAGLAAALGIAAILVYLLHRRPSR